MNNETNIKIAKKYESKISDIYKDSDGYWIELNEGFEFFTEECGVINCSTQKEVLKALKDIQIVEVETVLSLEEVAEVIKKANIYNVDSVVLNNNRIYLSTKDYHHRNDYELEEIAQELFNNLKATIPNHDKLEFNFRVYNDGNEFCDCINVGIMYKN